MILEGGFTQNKKMFTNLDEEDDDLNSDDLTFINELIANGPLDDGENYETPIENQFQIDSYNHIGLSPSPRSPVKSGTAANHCLDIFLGGTDLTPGITTSLLDPHFCSNLQCISCDHIVLRFPDMKWKDDINYLFLRNNYPNKVDSKLIPYKGSCAFCCQCTFKEANAICRLSMFETNWVCRGHRKSLH